MMTFSTQRIISQRYIQDSAWLDSFLFEVGSSLTGLLFLLPYFGKSHYAYAVLRMNV